MRQLSRHEPGQSSTGLEAVGLALAALLPVLGLFHVAVARLAAWVTGRAAPHATAVDGLVALTRLASTPGRPRLAWPPAVAVALPGAGVYWACFAAVAATG